MGADQVHPRIGGGDVGDVHLHPPLRVIELHQAEHAVHAAGGGGNVEMALVQPGGDAVVDDDAGFVQHQRIAHPANGSFP